MKPCVCKKKKVVTVSIREDKLDRFLRGDWVSFPKPGDKVVMIRQCDSCKGRV